MTYAGLCHNIQTYAERCQTAPHALLRMLVRGQYTTGVETTRQRRFALILVLPLILPGTMPQ